MPVFRTTKELLDRAKKLTEERLNALEKDVKHCLKKPYAPLPALAYCFATIDLFGALYKGNAGYDARTTKQFRNYIKRFMSYSTEETVLLQKIFRHKIVHLAIPKPVIKYKSRRIGWRYFHKHKGLHRKLKKLLKPEVRQVTKSWQVRFDYLFTIGIMDLMIDIRDSVENSRTGYLVALASTKTLQRNFAKAFREIYDPSK